MLTRLEEIQAEGLAALSLVTDEGARAGWHAAYLGRKGRVTEVVKSLGVLPRDERPAVGKRLNEVKNRLEQAYEERLQALKRADLDSSLESDRVDVTLPGRDAALGRLHPVTQALRSIYRIFAEMGFQVYRSLDVETDDLNFGLLNMPPHHPARDMWATFYTTTPGVILRTHTSPGQVRAMREFCPAPIRVVLPGTCYRYEQITARADIMFTQVEGLAVGTEITMASLKGTIVSFAQRMFGEDRRLRFRASYFPFTEPSAEVDMDCILCMSRGCRLCKGTGWLEIMGCGMVHPAVLRNGGYDPEVHSGFALGMGVERIAMLRYGIEDIRALWANDLRFLEQFG